MQEAAPIGFKVHYDFNPNSDYLTICPILIELEKFSVAGRFEDVLPAKDEDGHRLLREQCQKPIIIHHGPAECMIKHLCDGYMAGHAPVGVALKVRVVAEITNTPIMYQQAGGHINQVFLAHEAAVIPTATVDHVNLCHLWKDDVTVETMPIVGGSIQVPEGSGLGVTLDRAKLKRYAASEPYEKGRFLVRLRYAMGLTVYLRYDPDGPEQSDGIRLREWLHDNTAPGPVPSYENPIVSDFWDRDDDPTDFDQIWDRIESGSIWTESGDVT